jgi:hypothetical protein
MVMSYGNAYVARVAYGAKDVQTVKALQEAESYAGPSLVIAYSHCIAHGYDMALGPEQQKLAVETGTWPLYRFDPRRSAAGENPFQLDSAPPKVPLKQYLLNEARFRMIEQQDPDRFRRLAAAAQEHATRRFQVYEQFARYRPAAACAAGGGTGGGDGNGAATHDGNGDASAKASAPVQAHAAAHAPAAPAEPKAVGAKDPAAREVCAATGGGCYMRRGGHLGISSWR